MYRVSGRRGGAGVEGRRRLAKEFMGGGGGGVKMP